MGLDHLIRWAAIAWIARRGRPGYPSISRYCGGVAWAASRGVGGRVRTVADRPGA